MSSPADREPFTVTKVQPCCSMRSSLQLPLLLWVAAVLAFAAHHAWQNRADFQSAFAETGLMSPACASTASEGCESTAGVGCSHEELAAVDDNLTLSALAPENAAL